MMMAPSPTTGSNNAIVAEDNFPSCNLVVSNNQHNPVAIDSPCSTSSASSSNSSTVSSPTIPHTHHQLQQHSCTTAIGCNGSNNHSLPPKIQQKKRPFYQQPIVTEERIIQNYVFHNESNTNALVNTAIPTGKSHSTSSSSSSSDLSNISPPNIQKDVNSSLTTTIKQEFTFDKAQGQLAPIQTVQQQFQHKLTNNIDDLNEKKKKKRRNQAKSACENCRKAHTACSDNKPCARCVKLGIPCVEAPKKKQKMLKVQSNSSVVSVSSTTTTNTPTSVTNSNTISTITNNNNVAVSSIGFPSNKIDNGNNAVKNGKSLQPIDNNQSPENNSRTLPLSLPQQMNTNNNAPLIFDAHSLTPQIINLFHQYIQEGNLEKVVAMCLKCYQLITMTPLELKNTYGMNGAMIQAQNNQRNGFLYSYFYSKYNMMNVMRDILWSNYKKEYFNLLFKLIGLDDDKSLIRTYLQGVACNLSEVENENKIGLLSYSAIHGRIEIFKLLCEEFNLSLCQIKDEKYLPIHFACSYERVEIVEYILKNYPNQLNIQVSNNSSPLMVSCAYGSFKTVKLLIENRANVNLFDVDGLYAIHYAIKFNHFNIVSYLAQHHADLSVKTNSGQSIFDLVTDNDKKLMLELIVQNRSLNDRMLLQEDLIKNLKEQLNHQSNGCCNHHDERK
ncbi:hypothetical protein ABK040_007147 [Willaertia magna]